jgi:hypothetical protein
MRIFVEIMTVESKREVRFDVILLYLCAKILIFEVILFIGETV